MKHTNSKGSNNSIIDIEDIKAIMNVIVRNWYIIIAFVGIAYIASYIYTYKLTTIYGAQTQLVTESNDKINEQNIIGENYGNYYWWGSNPENITTIRVLKSYDLVENTVKRLKLDVSYFIVGRIKTTELYAVNPYEVELGAINPKYCEKEIEFKIIDEKRYSLKFIEDGEERIKEGFFDKEYVDPDIKLTIKNKSISKENAQLLSQNGYELVFHNPSTLVYRFQQALSVENPEGTNIFQIKLEDVIPERAKAFLDTLTQVYIENSLKTRLQINSNTLNYIERQMGEVTNVLKTIEDSLQSYKENKNILNLTKEEEDYFSKMSQYDQKRSEFQLELGALNSLEKYIIEDKDPQFLPPDVYLSSNDAFLKKGTEELYNLQIKENRTLNFATGDNYTIQESEQQIEKLKKNLLIYISNTKFAINENIKDIEEQLSFYVSNIKSIPKKQREILGIQRSLEVNQKMYLFLLEKKSNTIIGRAGILPQMKVLETARNIGVLGPNKQRIQLLFVLVGLIVSLIIVFVRLTFYTRIENLNELKKKVAYPVLGEIIYSPGASKTYINENEDGKSPLVESFRILRANLQFLSSRESSKVIVITSNSPGEGKTFTSINLATIIAKADINVLLIELDLHKPKIQKVLNMESDVGITSIVIGEAEIENAIKPTAVPNMSVLLSGPLPPNPSELILSESLKEILQYARRNFDFVIIDTPPLGLISDALILMKYANINLFVMNTKWASQDVINNVQEIVENHQLKNFGYILNGVKIKHSRYNYNKYAYSYYGYVRGEKE